MKRRFAPSHIALAALAYLAIVLAADTLATHHAGWRIFRWKATCGFDWFKFITWFLIPLAMSLPRIDPGYFGFSRWKKLDIAFLAVLAVAGIGAVTLIPLVPSLRGIYRGLGDAPPDVKLAYATQNLLWTSSWLIGWEFIHRYFLLRAWNNWLPRYGWLIVPLSEWLYHLQKPPLEAIGMALFSIAATYWCRKRNNMLLPLIAHLMIELELLAFLLLV